jgi:hypothetical protein
VPITEGGAFVATGWKIFWDVEPMVTELVTEVAGPVGWSVVEGLDIEVLIKGADVGSPVVLRLVSTAPDVCGT